MTVGVVLNPPGAPKSASSSDDARVVDQDVELAVAVLQVPGDRLVVLRPGDVEPDGLDLLDPLGLQRLGGGPALRLVAAADDDRDAQLAEPAGRLQADPLVRPRDERDLVRVATIVLLLRVSIDQSRGRKSPRRLCVH